MSSDSLKVFINDLQGSICFAFVPAMLSRQLHCWFGPMPEQGYKASQVMGILNMIEVITDEYRDECNRIREALTAPPSIEDLYNRAAQGDEAALQYFVDLLMQDPAFHEALQHDIRQDEAFMAEVANAIHASN